MKSALIPVFFCVVVGLFGQVEIGSMEIKTDTPLVSEINKGKKGIRVRAGDITVTGYQGKPLTFVLAVVKQEDTLVDYAVFESEKNISHFQEVSLELNNSELQNLFGRGSHQVYVVFYIQVVQDTEIQIIPGSYQARAVTIDLQSDKVVDRHVVDRIHNEETIRAKAVTDPKYRSLLSLAEKYDLVIGIRDFTIGSKATKEIYSWDFLTEADDKLLDRYVAVLIKHWPKLPVDFVKKTGLKAIVFVKNIYYSGEKVGGGFDVNDRIIICTVTDNFREDTIQHVLFHEYMHLIDNLMYGSRLFDNQKWAALNPPGTKYSHRGALDMIRENFSFIAEEHPQAGFLNGYCLADIYQDKAEIFSYLFIEAYYRKAQMWMKSDKYLSDKFKFMKEALRSISLEFTEEYFDKIR